MIVSKFPSSISKFFLLNFVFFGCVNSLQAKSAKINTTNEFNFLEMAGCTDPLAYNYNEDATSDDGSCVPYIYGCTNSMALNYSATANTDDGSCEINPSTNSKWTVEATSENHTILISNAIEFNLDGSSIENGDIIGVFFNKSGNEQCAGQITWNGLSQTITVYGDDYPADNGFEDTEVFQYKIWDNSAQKTFALQAEYNDSLPNSKYYYDDGISGVIGFQTGDLQEINLPAGWNFISTNINPFYSNLDSIFSDYNSDIELIKDETGQVYWPEYNINNIGDLERHKGYKIYTDDAVNLKIYGRKLNPSIYPILLNQGWSYMGYLRENPANIISVLGSISSDLYIVKNITGDVYWPQFGVNSIGNMKPGEGYQINMTNSKVFTFPSNAASLPALKTVNKTLESNFFDRVEKTSNHMHVAIPKENWEINIKPNDEIGIFSKSEKLIGSAVYNDNNLVVTIFGDQKMNGTAIRFKYWNSDNNHQFDLLINNKTELVYTKDDAMIIQSIKLKKTENIINNIEVSQTEAFLETKIDVEEATILNLYLVNVLGQRINLNTVEYSKGSHFIEIDKSDIPPGLYLLNFDSKTEHFSQKINVR